MTDNPVDQSALTGGATDQAEGAVPADCTCSGATNTQPEGGDTREGGSRPENRSPVKVFTCGGCPARWTLHRRAHCSGCHLTFTGISAFDQHRVHGACAAPAAVGLVERDGGLWGAPPMPPEVAAKLRAAGGAR